MRYAFIAVAASLIAACGFLFWFLRTPRVRIETFFYSPSESPKEGEAPGVAIATTADEATRIIKSDAFLTSIAENPMAFSLTLANGSNSFRKWLASQLKVGFDADHQLPTISVVVPAEVEQEGRTLVEGIAHEFVSHQLAALAKSASDHQFQLEEQFQQLGNEFARKSSEYAELTNGDVETAETRKLADEIDVIDHERAMVLEKLQSYDADASDSLHIRTITDTTVTKLAW